MMTEGPGQSRWVKAVRRTWASVDALELIAPVLLGTALFASLFIVLPIWLIRELWASGRPLVASAIAFVAVASLVVVIRDVRRRRVGVVTFVTGGAWIVCVAWVSIRLWF
jgi:hypothetical protein